MRKIVFLVVAWTLSGLPAMAGDDTAPTPSDVVSQVLAAVPLIDGHNDAPWAIRDRVDGRLSDFDFRDTGSLERPMHTDITRLRSGGLGAQFWSVWVPTDKQGDDAVIAVLEQIDLVRRLVATYPQDLELALTAGDIRRIHHDGRIASLIGMEGGHSIGDSLAVLRQLYTIGARYLTLTHWQTNTWADAATDEAEHDGLSGFGVAVVREMNRLGMMVDLSHVSVATMNDALDVSRAPVIFSHSGARAINPHPRNVPDEVLERVRDNGGLVMVNFGAFFIDSRVTERWAAAKAEKARFETLQPGHTALLEAHMEAWYEANPSPSVPLAVLADHIDHICDVAGINHVGLGSDYDGIGSLPEGLEDVSGYPRLLEELVRRGYSAGDIGKVAGLNLLRVMEEVEQVASDLQKTEAAGEARLPATD